MYVWAGAQLEEVFSVGLPPFFMCVLGHDLCTGRCSDANVIVQAWLCQDILYIKVYLNQEPK
jgi:uncharacterized MAPEG superfamily protein